MKLSEIVLPTLQAMVQLEVGDTLTTRFTNYQLCQGILGSIVELAADQNNLSFSPDEFEIIHQAGPERPMDELVAVTITRVQILAENESS